MSDRTYEYVECNCCGSEARKEHKGGFGGSVDLAPMGWLEVNNRDHRKMWDICPECAKEFTEWLLKRAGHLVEEAATKQRIREAVADITAIEHT